MNTDAKDNSREPSGTDQHATLAGRLSAALGMEDEISTGVYEEYLNRHRWPEHLDETVFLQIRERLTVLIEDTKQHKEVIEGLIREHG